MFDRLVAAFGITILSICMTIGCSPKDVPAPVVVNFKVMDRYVLGGVVTDNIVFKSTDGRTYQVLPRENSAIYYFNTIQPGDMISLEIDWRSEAVITKLK
jgi:hypothetical protein